MDGAIHNGIVSTIIPVYNRPVHVKEAVQSVLSQTYRPIEVIIVDDGSTDETTDVLRSLVDEYPTLVQVIHQQNRGPGIARQKGVERSKGEFIQFLDSDDLLVDTKFTLQVEGLRKNETCGVSYGKTRWHRPGHEQENVVWKRTGEVFETMFPSFLRSRWWATSTPLFRREVVERAGPWKDLWNEEDWEFDCRIAAQGVRLHYCSEFVCDIRWDNGPRLSSDGNVDPRKLRDRARAHELIYGHARRYGIGKETPEMRHFARELFLLSRQCGAAGLDQEAESLFCLAREASELDQSNGVDFKVYRMLANTIGWSKAGMLACWIDSIRSTSKRND